MIVLSNRHRTAAEGEWGRLLETLLPGTHSQPGASGGRSIDVSLWFPNDRALRFEVKTSLDPVRPLNMREQFQLTGYRDLARRGIMTWYTFKHIDGKNTRWRVFGLVLPHGRRGRPCLRIDGGAESWTPEAFTDRYRGWLK